MRRRAREGEHRGEDYDDDPFRVDTRAASLDAEEEEEEEALLPPQRPDPTTLPEWAQRYQPLFAEIRGYLAAIHMQYGDNYESSFEGDRTFEYTPPVLFRGMVNLIMGIAAAEPPQVPGPETERQWHTGMGLQLEEPEVDGWQVQRARTFTEDLQDYARDILIHLGNIDLQQLAPFDPTVPQTLRTQWMRNRDRVIQPALEMRQYLHQISREVQRLRRDMASTLNGLEEDEAHQVDAALRHFRNRENEWQAQLNLAALQVRALDILPGITETTLQTSFVPWVRSTRYLAPRQGGPHNFGPEPE